MGVGASRATRRASHGCRCARTPLRTVWHSRDSNSDLTRAPPPYLRVRCAPPTYGFGRTQPSRWGVTEGMTEGMRRSMCGCRRIEATLQHHIARGARRAPAFKELTHMNSHMSHTQAETWAKAQVSPQAVLVRNLVSGSCSCSCQQVVITEIQIYERSKRSSNGTAPNEVSLLVHY